MDFELAIVVWVYALLELSTRIARASSSTRSYWFFVIPEALVEQKTSVSLHSWLPERIVRQNRSNRGPKRELGNMVIMTNLHYNTCKLVS